MPSSADEGEILTLKQVADFLKVTERTIYRLAAAKQIPAFKVGGTWRLPLRQEPPQPFGQGGEINSSGLSCLIGVDLRATGFVLVQVELLEQLALPDQQIGQPAFMLE